MLRQAGSRSAILSRHGWIKSIVAKASRRACTCKGAKQLGSAAGRRRSITTASAQVRANAGREKHPAGTSGPRGREQRRIACATLRRPTPAGRLQLSWARPRHATGGCHGRFCGSVVVVEQSSLANIRAVVEGAAHTGAGRSLSSIDDLSGTGNARKQRRTATTSSSARTPSGWGSGDHGDEGPHPATHVMSGRTNPMPTVQTQNSAASADSSHGESNKVLRRPSKSATSSGSFEG